TARTASALARCKAAQEVSSMARPFHLVISGSFVIVGEEPDGDSVRFVADDADLFNQLENGHQVRLTPKNGSVQLRFEGVDATELHYGGVAQPGGGSARDVLLGWIGSGAVSSKN